MGCIELVEKFPSIKIAFYEIYNPIRFNTLIDISKGIDTKKEALSKYHYGMLKKKDIFITSILSLNRFRSLFTLKDSYYEAFWIPDTIPNPLDIIDWFTHSLFPQPEDKLLRNLKVLNSTVYQIKIAEDKLKERDEVIWNLSLESI